ncbi:MAG: hypothetical protein AB1Z67_08660 [Candidatus Limnocylindrales bacterium]
MSSRHGNSRRQAYGRRMKELRTRRSGDLDIDLEGPASWSRGDAWDSERSFHSRAIDAGDATSSARAR